MFDLVSILRFKPILLVSERAEDGQGVANRTAEQTQATARRMIEVAAVHGLAAADCLIDPAISPIGTDSDGQFQRLMGALRLIPADPVARGAHLSVGLSNFTVMLPPTKSPLESAFLTMAMPLGLDHVIGSVKRNYRILVDDDLALQCLVDCLALEVFDVILRVQEYYS